MNLLGGLRPARESGEGVVWLGAEHAADRIGGKAATLSRLAAHWPVPDGFCLPVDVHRSHLRGPSTSDLVRLISPSYRRLAERTGMRKPAVAVRSSGVDEDGEQRSFAGQHDTFLNVKGARAIARAVERCWASNESARSLAYRRAGGLGASASMAVLVQRLVDAGRSAVVFSANPVTGVRDEILIEASWGLGEAVVDGSVTPDTYVVAKGSQAAVTERRIADKDRMVKRARGGTRVVPVPDRLRRAAVLDDGRCLQLAQLATDVERDIGAPVDLECALENGRLHLLQARPITTLAV